VCLLERWAGRWLQEVPGRLYTVEQARSIDDNLYSPLE
jgi:hypothetical protein